MHTQSATAARRLRPVWTSSYALALAAAMFIPAATAMAVDIVRVEEDWELVVGDPDESTNSPQVTCVTSSSGGIDGHYAALTINHKTLPDFEPGGLQLQVWDGTGAVGSSKFPKDDELGSGDTVSWTLSMRVEGGQLHFEVTQGNSATWGSLGGQGYLRQTVASNLTNLNGYSPAVSVENSGVGYAGNRVTSLRLKAVRAYSAEGLVAEDNSPKSIFPHE